MRRIECTGGFVAFLCLMCYLDPSGCFFPFLLAASVHEAAHLLTLRVMHAPIHKLRLSLGGAQLITAPLPYGREILAAAAGPAANLLLLLLTLRSRPVHALVNAALLLYNLLPFYPLDGGRVLRAVCALALPAPAAVRTERIVCTVSLLALGVGAVYLTCVLHVGLWPVLLFASLLLRSERENSPKSRPFLRVRS